MTELYDIACIACTDSDTTGIGILLTITGTVPITRDIVPAVTIFKSAVPAVRPVTIPLLASIVIVDVLVLCILDQISWLILILKEACPTLLNKACPSTCAL